MVGSKLAREAAFLIFTYALAWELFVVCFAVESEEIGDGK
jgi:hypothetical protein